MRIIVKKLSREKYALKVNDLESVHLRNGAVYFNILKDKIGIKEAGSCERLTDLLPAEYYEVDGKKYQSILELSQALLEMINSEKGYFDQTKEKVDQFERENQPKIERILQESRKIEALKGEVREAKFNVLSRDTRFDNPSPKDYTDALSLELKLSRVIGLSSNTEYTSMITAKSNGDLRSVGAYQIGGGFSGLYFRNTKMAADWNKPETASWKPWQKILTDEEIKSLPKVAKNQVKYLLGLNQDGKIVKVAINEIK